MQPNTDYTIRFTVEPTQSDQEFSEPSLDQAKLKTVIRSLEELSDEAIFSYFSERSDEELLEIGRSLSVTRYEPLISRLTSTKVLPQFLRLSQGFLELTPPDHITFTDIKGFIPGIVTAGKTPRILATLFARGDIEDWRENLFPMADFQPEVLAVLLARSSDLTGPYVMNRFFQFLIDEPEVPEEILQAVQWLPKIHGVYPEIEKLESFQTLQSRRPIADRQWNYEALRLHTLNSSELAPEFAKLNSPLSIPQKLNFIYRIWLRGYFDLGRYALHILQFSMTVSKRDPLPAGIKPQDTAQVYQLVYFDFFFKDFTCRFSQEKKVLKPFKGQPVEFPAIPIFIQLTDNLRASATQSKQFSLLSSVFNKTTAFLTLDQLLKEIQVKLQLLDKFHDIDKKLDVCASLYTILHNVYFFGPLEWTHYLYLILESSIWQEYFPKVLTRELIAPAVLQERGKPLELRQFLKTYQAILEHMGLDRTQFANFALSDFLPRENWAFSYRAEPELWIELAQEILEASDYTCIEEEILFDLFAAPPFFPAHYEIVGEFNSDYKWNPITRELLRRLADDPKVSYESSAQWLQTAECLIGDGEVFEANIVLSMLLKLLDDSSHCLDLTALLGSIINNPDLIRILPKNAPKTMQMLVELQNQILKIDDSLLAEQCIDLIDILAPKIPDRSKRKKRNAESDFLRTWNKKKSALKAYAKELEIPNNPEVEIEKKRQKQLLENRGLVEKVLSKPISVAKQEQEIDLEANERIDQLLEQLQASAYAHVDLEPAECKQKTEALAEEFFSDIKAIQRERERKIEADRAAQLLAKISDEISLPSDREKRLEQVAQQIIRAQNLQKERVGDFLAEISEFQESRKIEQRYQKYQEQREGNLNDLLSSVRMKVASEPSRSRNPLEGKVKELKTQLQEKDEEIERLRKLLEEKTRAESPSALEGAVRRYTREDLFELMDQLSESETGIQLGKLRKLLKDPLKKTRELLAVYGLLPLEGHRIKGSHRTARLQTTMVTLASHVSDAKPEQVQDCYQNVGEILSLFLT